MAKHTEDQHALIDRFGIIVRNAILDAYLRHNRWHDNPAWREAQALHAGLYTAIAAELLRLGVTPPPAEWRHPDEAIGGGGQGGAAPEKDG